MKLLNRARQDIDVAVIIVFSLESEGPGTRPGLDNQVVRHDHAFAADGGIDVIAEIFHARAAHEARNNASPTDHVEHSDLFCYAQRVMVQRQNIANNATFGSLDAPG